MVPWVCIGHSSDTLRGAGSYCFTPRRSPCVGGTFSTPFSSIGKSKQFRKAHPSCFPKGRSHSEATVDGFSRGAASSREREVPGLGSAGGSRRKKAAVVRSTGLVAGRMRREADAKNSRGTAWR